MHKRPSPRFFIFTLLLVVVLSLFPLYSYYKQAAAPVPPGVTLGGVDVTGLKDLAAIGAHMAPIYQQPIGVKFQERMLVLHPEEVGFTADVDATIADAGRYLEGLDFVDIAVREAIGLPQQRRDVALRYAVDADKLRTWLERTAADFDYAPVAARVRLPETPITVTAVTASAPVSLTLSATEPITGALPTPAPIRAIEWTAGTPGYRVDVAASIPRLLAALASHDRRMADLALVETSPTAPTIEDLAEQLPRVLDSFPAFSAVYVQDLQNGDEAQADGNAAFSGMATLKLALAVALMEALPNGVVDDDPEAQQVGQWLDAAIGQGDDAAADQALAWLGDGDVTAGARRVTALLAALGLENSYLQTGFTVTTELPKLTTPSNQREKPNTRPDPNLQTTPEDVGRLMAAIYACTQDKGLLRTTYAATITPDECRTILFYFTHNELRDVIWRGLPDYETRWLVHQQGLSLWQHGNVALVWGPTGPYVISIFLFNPGLTGWEVANRAAIDLSRMVWDFFAFQRTQGGPLAGEPPKLAPPSGYTAIDKYAPAAANPEGK